VHDVTESSALLDAAVLREMGLFDERFFHGLCARARRCSVARPGWTLERIFGRPWLFPGRWRMAVAGVLGVADALRGRRASVTCPAGSADDERLG
jgi:hypothetical protein